MKTFKNLTATFTLALAALWAPLAAKAAGDIYEIHPCDEFGNYVDRTGAVALESGDTARFMVRLIRKDMTTYDSRFYPVFQYQGVGSEYLAELSGFEIGIYVNGRLTTAKMEHYWFSDDEGKKFFTDLVFAYTVKPGDFARPIRFADSDGKIILPDSDSTGSYFIPAYSQAAWKIVCYTDDTRTTVDREAVFAFRPQADIADWGAKPPDHADRITDADMTECNFMVETIDFATPVEENGPKYRSPSLFRV